MKLALMISVLFEQLLGDSIPAEGYTGINKDTIWRGKVRSKMASDHPEIQV